MDKDERMALEAAGFVLGDAEDFLELNTEERDLLAQAVKTKEFLCPKCQQTSRNVVGNIWICPSYHLREMLDGGLFHMGVKAESYIGFALIGLTKERDEIDQILGKALGYPECFPEVSNIDDTRVCTGEHTVVTLAMEAADRIKGNAS